MLAREVTLKQWGESNPSPNSIFTVGLNLYVRLQKEKPLERHTLIMEDILIDYLSLAIIKFTKVQTITLAEERRRQQGILSSYYNKNMMFTANIILSLINKKPTQFRSYLNQAFDLKNKDEKLFKFAHDVYYKKLTSSQFVKMVQEMVDYYRAKGTQMALQVDEHSSEISVIIDRVGKRLGQLSEKPRQTERSPGYRAILQELNKLDAKIPKSWRVLNAIGVVYQLSKNFEDAYKYYKSAQKIENKNPLISKNLASLSHDEGKQLEYIQNLEQAIKYSNTNGNVLYDQLLADAYDVSNPLSKEKKIKLLKSLYTKSTNVLERIRYMMKMSEVYYLSQEFSQCGKLLKDINEFIPAPKRGSVTSSSTNSSKTSSSKQNPDTDGTTDQISQLLQINNLNQLLLNLAQNKNISQSQIKDKYLQNKDSPLYSKMYANTLMQNQRYKEARDIFLQFQRQFENDYDFNWNLAICFYQLSDSSCFWYFRRCGSINPQKKKQVMRTIVKISDYSKQIPYFTDSCSESSRQRTERIIQEAQKYR